MRSGFLACGACALKVSLFIPMSPRDQILAHHLSETLVHATSQSSKNPAQLQASAATVILATFRTRSNHDAYRIAGGGDVIADLCAGMLSAAVQTGESGLVASRRAEKDAASKLRGPALFGIATLAALDGQPR